MKIIFSGEMDKLKVSLLVCIFILNVLAEDVRVKTKYGEVEGFTYETTKGKKANIFLGIPFASPPVGDLKLEVGLIEIFLSRYSFKE